MKPLTIALSVAVLALPLCASDGTEQAKQSTPSTTLAKPAAQQQDSPLVRAAKSTGRLGKKPAIVITNETLTKTGGHFTTTTTMAPLPAAEPASGPTDLDRYREAQRQKKAEAAEKARKEEAAKKARAAQRAAADYYGESIEERVDDPAMQEHQMEKMTSTQPQTQPPSKPPQN